MSEDIRDGIKSGMIIRVHQRIKEINTKGEEKERIQIFEGTVLAVKHGKESGATVTVRKVSNGVGVEKIFPIYSPMVEKIELIREMAVKQSKAFYLRTYKKKLREIKKKIIGKKVENPVLEVEEVKKVEPVVEEVPVEEVKEEVKEEKVEEKKEEKTEK